MKHRMAVLLIALLLPAGACRRNPAANASRGQFPECAGGQRYLAVTNTTSRTFDVYLMTGPSSGLFMTTVYPESRIDVPIDPSITSGVAELRPVRQTSRVQTGTQAGSYYAVVTCRR